MAERKQEEPRLHLGEKTFSIEDQRAFAALSGDVNPLHMDPVLARRLLTGRPVVHGVNILLHAIELWLPRYGQCPTEIACSFTHAVSVGEAASFAEVSRSTHEHSIEVSVNGLVCVRITLRIQRSGLPRGAVHTAGDAEQYDRVETATPLEPEPKAQRGRQYAVPLRPTGARPVLTPLDAPTATRRYAGLAALSYFVGMVCPGMHSIFSSIDVRFDDAFEDRSALYFSVDKFDERFGLFVVSVRGLLAGEIRAFVRPPPARQSSLHAIRSHVKEGEFAGTTSLIIGGSRGLGELTAKVLASGEGRTFITYATGADDARTVSQEINASGLARCDALAFDVLNDSIASLPVDFGALHGIYYFATPRIYRKKSSVFDRVLFDELFEIYVTRFYDICAGLESTLTKPVRIFFPSSVYIDSRPRDFAEYAMAKAAAEVLIGDVNRVFRKVSILSSRLPRLGTDQTAGLLSVATESQNIDAMLPIVRRMSASLSA